MSNHAVALKVTPYLRIECKFWLGDDGWNGTSEHPAITVQAGSFEHAKCDMEAALGKHIEELLKKGRQTKGQAASFLSQSCRPTALRPSASIAAVTARASSARE